MTAPPPARAPSGRDLPLLLVAVCAFVAGGSVLAVLRHLVAVRLLALAGDPAAHLGDQARLLVVDLGVAVAVTVAAVIGWRMVGSRPRAGLVVLGVTAGVALLATSVPH